MEWIKIKDKPAKHEGKIVLYGKEYGTEVGDSLGSQDGNTGYIYPRKEGVYPTHWLEIPQPPKDGCDCDICERHAKEAEGERRKG